jgi:hypothetical protein
MNQLLNEFLKEFLKFVAENPLAYPYLACGGAAILGLIATCFYGWRAKRVLKHLEGPVPELSETALLRQFEYRHQALRYKAQNPGILAAICSVVNIILIVWLYRGDVEASSILLIGATALQGASLLTYLIWGCRYDSNSDNLLYSRPELNRLKYLPMLPEVKSEADQLKADECRLYWGSLDDFVCAFDIGKYEVLKAPALDQHEAKALSDAQWQAIHGEKPLKGELVLLLWRDGSKRKIKTLVTRITSVEDVPTEALVASSGITNIKAAAEQFCGGRVAHFSGIPNDKIERGWLTTADRAHILLASLGWLSRDQQEVCYQLINPGKPYPELSEWAQGQ